MQTGHNARLSALVLAGFMGSGKTTVGTLLARQLAWRFVDLDERIENSAAMRIPEIFTRLGESGFRQLEAEQLRAILGRAMETRDSLILALGGGTYAQPGCPEFLRASAVPVLWLDSPIEVLFSRCMTMNGRPLFRDEASFRDLYLQRLPSYKTADFRVDSSGQPADVVANILRQEIVPALKNQAHLVVPRSQ